MATKPKTDKPLESDVQAECLSLLSAHGFAVVTRTRKRKGEKQAPPIWRPALDRFQAAPFRGIVWRENTGVLRDKRNIPVSFGIPGRADIIGIVRDSNRWRFFALEVKRPGNKPSPEQRAFLALVNELDGVGLWVDSSEELLLFMRESGWAK